MKSDEMMRDTVFRGELKLRKSKSLLLNEELEERFPKLANVPAWNANYGDPVIGPAQLINRRKVIWKSRRRIKLNPRKCLCFVFGIGEDVKDRATTRIGGLPFWPRGLKWPTKKKVPKQFVAQIDFRDVIWPEPLPGDILTIHDDEDLDRFDGTTDGPGLTLTWHSTKSAGELVNKSDLPKGDDFYDTGPFYSRPVVVTDYKPTSDAQDLHEGPPGFQHYTIHGTKIGGHSQFYGDNWQESVKKVNDPVFLCSVGSVWKGGPKGWLPTKQGFTKAKPIGTMWLDVGTLIIVYPKGHPDKLHWMMYLS